MATTGPRELEKLLTGPLQGWRDDDPTLLPHCALQVAEGCAGDIRVGDRYRITPTLKVICVPCVVATLRPVKKGS